MPCHAGCIKALGHLKCKPINYPVSDYVDANGNFHEWWLPKVPVVIADSTRPPKELRLDADASTDAHRLLA
jgi:hypothetical protein